MTANRLARSAPMKRKTPLEQKTPLKRTGFLRRAKEQVTKKVVALKSRGMKGRTPTVLERRFMDAVAGLGCIACRKDGQVNPWISLHHIAGRTAVNAHMYVLPLCANHHQHDDADPAGRIGIHPHKARFESMYGTQMELLAECVAMIGWDPKC
ncbi:MAG: Ref family recombination enhancement nuclease [Candidatus Angelobacter sp.]